MRKLDLSSNRNSTNLQKKKKKVENSNSKIKNIYKSTTENPKVNEIFLPLMSKKKKQRKGKGKGKGKSRERKKKYQEIRQGNDLPNDKPLNSISKETHKGRHEKHNPKRKIHQSQPRRPPENLPHIRSHSQVIKLNLRNSQHRFQRRRVLREIEVGPSESLNPNSGHQNHPFPRLPCHRDDFYDRTPKRRSFSPAVDSSAM